MQWFLLALRRYADFSGRSRRKEYWFFFLFANLIGVAAWFLDHFTGLIDPDTHMGVFGGLATLVLLIPGIAVGVRRLHDTGRRGWWLLLALAPLIGAIVLLFFFLKDSAAGGNAFGPNPKSDVL